MKKFAISLTLIALTLFGCSLVTTPFLTGNVLLDLPILYDLTSISRALETEYSVTVDKVELTVWNDDFTYGPQILTFDTLTDEATGVISNIVEGEYSVKMELYYLQTDSTYKLIASGEKTNVTISADSQTDITLTLSMAIGLGSISVTGSFGLNGIVYFTGYDDGDGEIYKINLDGSELVKLTDNTNDDKYPSISPDGTKVAFVSNRSGNHDVYMMDTDGSGTTRITTNIADDGETIRSITWYPDGTKLLVSAKNSSVIRLYTITLSDLSVTALTGSDLDADNASFSIDGSKLYMRRNTPYNGYSSEIYFSDLTASSFTKLTTSTSPSTARSEDPQEINYLGTNKIFYSYYNGDNWQIYYMDSDGSNPTNFSNNSFNELAPNSNNSVDNCLVYVSKQDDKNNIWVSDFSSDPIKLTDMNSASQPSVWIE